MNCDMLIKYVSNVARSTKYYTNEILIRGIQILNEMINPHPHKHTHTQRQKSQQINKFVQESREKEEKDRERQRERERDRNHLYVKAFSGDSHRNRSGSYCLVKRISRLALTA